MIIQNRDGSLAREPGCSQLLSKTRQGYSAVVVDDVLDSESSIIDELIGLAFDRLGAWHLEVRVHPKAGSRALVEAG